jgi:uncharacterized protein (DUF1810 family)
MLDKPQDRFELRRFVKAQNIVYAQVLEELAAGRKASHWMWFVFPQIAGLGASAMSQRYAISGLEEAKAYLDDPILGGRLRECAGFVCRHADRSARDIMGSPDDLKLQASATLFDRAGGGEVFAELLRLFFDGKPHAETLRLLAVAQPSKT